MTDAELKTLLASLKDRPELGGSFGGAAEDKVWASIVAGTGIRSDARRPKTYSVWEFLEYARWEFNSAFMRPLAMTAGAAGLMISGWATTAAAGNSLPGDILYPVKLAGERVQIRLAGSTQDRIRLHTTFAERRLQEAIEITSGPGTEKKAGMDRVIAGLKEELDSAHGELAQLETVDPKSAAEMTAVLSRKTDALSVLAQQSAADAPADAKQGAQEVKETVKQAETQTVNALVRSFETTQEPVSGAEVTQSFQREYQQISTRLALSRARLNTLRLAAGALPAEVAASFTEFAADALVALQGFDRSLADAMNIMAAGGYRRAFAILQQADVVLDEREPLIAQKEIELTALRSTAEETPKEN